MIISLFIFILFGSTVLIRVRTLVSPIMILDAVGKFTRNMYFSCSVYKNVNPDIDV